MTAFYVRYIENGRECWDVVENVHSMADAVQILSASACVMPTPLPYVSSFGKIPEPDFTKRHIGEPSL